MFEKVKDIEGRYAELEEYMGNPDIIKNRDVYQKYVKEHIIKLNKIVNKLIGE